MATVTERFARWVSWTKKSQEQVGALLHCHQTHVSDLCRGERLAGNELGFRIEDVTRDWPGGQILAREWVEEKKARRARRSATAEGVEATT